MSKIKKYILKIPIVNTAVRILKRFLDSILLYSETKKKLCSVKEKENRIFYIGIPAHTNLGDLAQGVCIRRFLKKHYSDRVVVEIQTNALVNTYFSALPLLKKAYKKGDLIVFQSGYTTTDLGGYADEMHKAVIRLLPDAKMLMMPQTIFFQSDARKKETSEVYSSAKDMLFLARDKISFEMAKEMFTGIRLAQYPDIVTTLIGTKTFSAERNGILFCCRNDGEKYYSDADINHLMEKCKAFSQVEKTDTTKDGKTASIVDHAEDFIDREIGFYSKFKLMITDRYHGTILSLVAGTPVIIIKTTDHKVITGANWFKGVYDDYVYVVDNLDEAYELAGKILNADRSYHLQPYFEREYYDKLPGLLGE